MKNCTLYVLHDYVVDGIHDSIKSLLNDGKDFSLLTGDKMTSAIEIGEIIGLIENKRMIVIDKIEDIENIDFNK